MFRMCSVWLVPPILDIDFIEIITEGLPYFHQELGQQTLRSANQENFAIGIEGLWIVQYEGLQGNGWRGSFHQWKNLGGRYRLHL